MLRFSNRFQPLPNRLHARSGVTLAKRHRNAAVRIKRTEFLQVVRCVARNNIRKNGVGDAFLRWFQAFCVWSRLGA